MVWGRGRAGVHKLTGHGLHHSDKNESKSGKMGL